MRSTARAFALAIALGACPAVAQHLPGSERVEFATDGANEKLSGFLFLPAGASANAKVPAVVLVHGSGGVRDSREGFWGREFASAGLAVLAIDSFTARGISSTVADQSRITTAQMVHDAFGALAFLAARAEVHGELVAVMGMSRGGAVAMQAADERAAKGGSLRFAAHIPMYPGCSVQYRNPRMKGPMLILIGANDDYTGVKSCAEYAERIRSAGGKVELKTYEGAHHGFDTEGQHHTWVARAQNFRDCTVLVEDDGRSVLAGTGEAIPLEDLGASIRILARSCMRTGATVAFNGAARKLALDDVKAFIKTQLSK